MSTSQINSGKALTSLLTSWREQLLLSLANSSRLDHDHRCQKFLIGCRLVWTTVAVFTWTLLYRIIAQPELNIALSNHCRNPFIRKILLPSNHVIVYLMLSFWLELKYSRGFSMRWHCFKKGKKHWQLQIRTGKWSCDFFFFLSLKRFKDCRAPWWSERLETNMLFKQVLKKN